MRIVAGMYRGRELTPINVEGIRPTLDRVKEAVFSMIQFQLGEVFVDLFCGSGNIGLEALSRGVNSVYFCDNSREALSILENNISKLKADKSKIRILNGEYKHNLTRLGGIGANVVYIDPPYENMEIYKELPHAVCDIVADNAIVVIEHNTPNITFDERGFTLSKQKKYGQVYITVYTKEQDD